MCLATLLGSNSFVTLKKLSKILGMMIIVVGLVNVRKFKLTQDDKENLSLNDPSIGDYV